MQTGITFIDNLLRDPLFAAMFLFCIVVAVTVHEFAHALVASKQGDQTARFLGRVTLNPIKHLDPLGSLLFILAGIGWGKPVPVDPSNLKDGKLGDFYVSMAGIAMNLVVAFIFAIPLQLAILGGVSPDLQLWLKFCEVMVTVNILLAAFNILPIPPLDGSKAIGILVPRRFERSYQEYLRVGPVLLIGLLLGSYLLHYNFLAIVIEPLDYIFRFLIFIPTSLS